MRALTPLQSRSPVILQLQSTALPEVREFCTVHIYTGSRRNTSHILNWHFCDASEHKQVVIVAAFFFFLDMNGAARAFLLKYFIRLVNLKLQHKGIQSIAVSIFYSELHHSNEV